uniref:RRM domain-containing protein n=1 Tax=Rhabditophanes sp. KR3021 TaxID=114890 RepID=A0AC35UBY5_9BILA
MGERRGPPNIQGLHSVKVDNLSYNTTPHELRKMFDKYGEIGDIHIPRNRADGKSKGFGFVRFYSRKEAERASDRNDGRRVDGRSIRCSLARYERPIDEKRPSRRDRSRSPEYRRRDGGRRSRSNDRYRSRSPVRDRSRSPIRQRSRSPIRQRSRSPAVGSRTRTPSRSPSPPKKSRSVSPRESRSPSSDGKKFSKSPKSVSHSPANSKTPSPKRDTNYEHDD